MGGHATGPDNNVWGARRGLTLSWLLELELKGHHTRTRANEDRVRLAGDYCATASSSPPEAANACSATHLPLGLLALVLATPDVLTTLSFVLRHLLGAVADELGVLCARVDCLARGLLQFDQNSNLIFSHTVRLGKAKIMNGIEIPRFC